MPYAHLDTAAQRVAALHFTDTAEITHNPNPGTRVLDPVTLAPTEPAATVVWSGPCLVGAARPAQADHDATATTNAQTTHRIRIPHDAPPIPTGATLTVTGSLRSPTLIGSEYSIVNDETSTVAVSRFLYAERTERAA